MPDTDISIQDGLLTVEQLDEGAQLRLSLRGELDLSNVKTAEAAVNEALASSKKVLIDLGSLEFLDSTGIALLVGALQRSDAERLSFVPSKSSGVRRLLGLTGLDTRMARSTTGSPRSASSLPAV
ncbi:MAG TPA: STAS domain-containing protein [Solirubrobacterales bacterium]|nr:STAS domain-containing protein [Solirubrobacterales bacterium]